MQYSLKQLAVVVLLAALLLVWCRFFLAFPLSMTSEPHDYTDLWWAIFSCPDFQIAATGTVALLIGVCFKSERRAVRWLSRGALGFAVLAWLGTVAVISG